MYNSIDVPLFITIEDDALNMVKIILNRSNIHINNPMIVTDAGKSSEFADIIRKKLKIRKEMVVTINSNTYEDVKIVEKHARKSKVDFIIGVGGGKALDISKLASFRYGSYLISIPTLPSHDGIASPVASIIIDGKRMSLGASMPVGIIVDLGVIKNAPQRFIHSGIMDLISNLSAIKDWELSYAKGYEVKFNGFSKAIAYSSAESVLNYNDENIYSDDFLSVLLNGLVLSGIAMEIAGSSRPASGAEHNFSHAYDSLYTDNTLLHGEKVGIGHLLISYFRDKIEYKRLLDCFSRYGIFKSFKKMKLDKSKVYSAFEYARIIRKDRYSILNELELDKGEIITAISDIFKKIEGK